MSGIISPPPRRNQKISVPKSKSPKRKNRSSIHSPIALIVRAQIAKKLGSRIISATILPPSPRNQEKSVPKSKSLKRKNNVALDEVKLPTNFNRHDNGSESVNSTSVSKQITSINHVDCTSRRSYQHRNIEHFCQSEYRQEVQRRAKAEQSAERSNQALRLVRKPVCHLCHRRRCKGVLFPCGNPSHAYCEMHLQMKFGVCLKEIETQKIHLDFCPVCCLICTCAECARRLDAVALDFKKKCVEQGKTIDAIRECQFEVLTTCIGRAGSLVSKNLDVQTAALTLDSRFKCVPPRTSRVDEGWREHLNTAWNLMFDELRKFKDSAGHCSVPYSYSDNPELGRWVSRQRVQRSKISKERAYKLDSIGFIWKTKPMNLNKFHLMYCAPHNTLGGQ